jgi:hypothetical protein
VTSSHPTAASRSRRLPSDEAAANVANLRQLLEQQDELKAINRTNQARRT